MEKRFSPQSLRALVWALPCLWMSCSSGAKEYIRNTGRIFGTYYSVVYQQPDGVDLQDKLEQRMQEFDRSLSTFNPVKTVNDLLRPEHQ